MVSVAFAADVPAMDTGLVEPKLKVGRYCAPVGLVAMTAVNTTLPVNPLLGVRVMVDVLPVPSVGKPDSGGRSQWELEE
jgi:hypothetical protein